MCPQSAPTAEAQNYFSHTGAGLPREIPSLRRLGSQVWVLGGSSPVISKVACVSHP